MLILGAVTALALATVVVLVLSLTGMFSDRQDPSAAAPAQPAPIGTGDGGSGPAAEAELAARPMLQVPLAAIQPHTLSTRTAGPPIVLPQPQQFVATLVPIGFPDTAEGAVAQLVELMKAGLSGGDPQVWAQIYNSLAEPGAQPANRTTTSNDLADLRRGAHLRPTGASSSGLRMSWAPTSAMVKGSTADGTYVVACALGEFVADNNGRVVSFGWGDCLPMRRVGDQWRVASGPTAAIAPSAWPGSDEAVAAGWRDIQR
ncbi:hypothetical protein [Pseudonocardia sp. HH130630-07]|uniref:hypothetical protein n=1 Tax=Pseudonocardia sp. HH130630-07 TaxID=1690815 RepID=UPI00081512AB|nr:hypothetical protein [Pseudonocardia sp. HH130630-07]ANY10869.1 hypothetical protein AFB00_31255 [Pseudonocardia sp. HH130630-07]